MLNYLGATRIGVWGIKNLVSPLQRWLYHTSDGKFMSNVGKDRRVLLLTTKGRRTGKDRIIPVFYLSYGNAIVICNVRPKHESTNPWVLNLRSHPFAKLQIGDEAAIYAAREATRDEITLLWPQLTQLWPPFQSHYEQGGRRSIFILTRA